MNQIFWKISALASNNVHFFEPFFRLNKTSLTKINSPLGAIPIEKCLILYDSLSLTFWNKLQRGLVWNLRNMYRVLKKMFTHFHFFSNIQLFYYIRVRNTGKDKESSIYWLSRDSLLNLNLWKESEIKNLPLVRGRIWN